MYNPVLATLQNSRSNGNNLMPQQRANPQALQQIKNIMQRVKMAQNPQLMFNQLLLGNPVVREAMNFIRQNGGNGEQAFYNLAKQYGVDPQTVLNSLKF